jgi:branched-chain amino acid transport system permease protein
LTERAAESRSRVDVVSWAILALALLVLLFAPLIFTEFFLSVILTKALWLGIAAASLIFLASYAGMVSLGQVGLYAIAGMTYANLVAADGGLDAAWNPWIAVIAALLAATLVGVLFGAVASRSEGIYFLMITLALGVIVFYFFAQVTQLSGFGGVNVPELPSIIGNPGQDPVPLFYVTLGASVLVFFGIRYLVRTPFGLTMQGLRDEPDRMRALGFNVTLHRTLAFAAGALIAGIAGVLSVWYNQRISPGAIGLGQTIDVLVIAVIGGLYRIEGAWVGAIFFALLDNYSREYTPDIGEVLGPERFNTLIGIIFLVIVLVSPGGLVGLWDKAKERMGPSGGGRSRAGPAAGGTPPPVQEPLERGAS